MIVKLSSLAHRVDRWQPVVIVEFSGNGRVTPSIRVQLRVTGSMGLFHGVLFSRMVFGQSSKYSPRKLSAFDKNTTHFSQNLSSFFSLSLSLSLYKKKRRIVSRFVQLFRETCVVEKPNLSLDNLIVSREQKRADIKYHVERRQTWETMGQEQTR